MQFRFGMCAAPCVMALSVSLQSAQPVRAQTPEQFYAGKQVRFIIRSQPGGGYDQYARLLGRHIGKHIPGKPSIVPINMPGGGGIIAANHVALVAPKDGSILTIVSQGMPVDQALGLNKTLKADARSFGWVGNISNSNQLLVTWHTSKTKTLADARQRETMIGSTGAGSISTQLPALYNHVLGTKFKIIYGYPDGGDVNIAMERGELEGRSTNTWASYKAVTPHYISNKFISPIVQIGMRKEAGLEHVPLLREQDMSADDRAVVEFMSKAVTVGRPIATTPGVPPDRLAALRRAFDATLRDPEFKSDAEKARAEIDPMTGEELEAVINDIVGTPPAVVERVKAALEPKKEDAKKANVESKGGSGD